MNKNLPLFKPLLGALKSCIHAHGPITLKWTSSAAKRIIGNLSAFEKISYPDEPLKESILVLMAEMHKSLSLNRINLEKVTEGGKKANIAGRIQESRRLLLLLNNLLKKQNRYSGRDAKVHTDNHIGQIE